MEGLLDGGTDQQVIAAGSQLHTEEETSRSNELSHERVLRLALRRSLGTAHEHNLKSSLPTGEANEAESFLWTVKGEVLFGSFRRLQLGLVEGPPRMEVNEYHRVVYFYGSLVCYFLGASIMRLNNERYFSVSSATAQHPIDAAISFDQIQLCSFLLQGLGLQNPAAALLIGEFGVYTWSTGEQPEYSSEV